MVFWLTTAIFILIDLAVLFYIFKHRVSFARAQACRERICGYWNTPKCTNGKVSQEEFDERNGRPEEFPCSTLYLGRPSPEEHSDYVASRRLKDSILISGFVLSLLVAESSILKNIHDSSKYDQRIQKLEHKIELLEDRQFQLSPPGP